MLQFRQHEWGRCNSWAAFCCCRGLRRCRSYCCFYHWNTVMLIALVKPKGMKDLFFFSSLPLLIRWNVTKCVIFAFKFFYQIKTNSLSVQILLVNEIVFFVIVRCSNIQTLFFTVLSIQKQPIWSQSCFITENFLFNLIKGIYLNFDSNRSKGTNVEAPKVKKLFCSFFQIVAHMRLHRYEIILKCSIW